MYECMYVSGMTYIYLYIYVYIVYHAFSSHPHFEIPNFSPHHSLLHQGTSKHLVQHQRHRTALGHGLSVSPYGPMGTPHISSQWLFNGLKPKKIKCSHHSGKWKIIHSHSHPYFTSAAGTLTEISRLQDLEPLRNVIVLDEDLALGCSMAPWHGKSQSIYV